MPYWPKYSVDRKVGISYSSRQLVRFQRRVTIEQSGAYLLFCESRADTDYVDYVALNDAYIGEMTPTKSVKLFAFTLSLFLLLSESLVAKSNHVSKLDRALAPIPCMKLK